MASRSGGSKPSYVKNKDLEDDGFSMDEDLSEDDDLMADFNATSNTKPSSNAKGSSYPKPMSRTSMYDEGFSSQKSLMMTIKKPMQPAASSKRPISPPTRGTMSKLGSVGEQDSGEDSYSDDDLRATPNKPSFLRSQQPKSPSLQKQREVAAAPKPQPRQRHVDAKSPSITTRHEATSRQSPYDSIDGMALEDRATPVSSRNTPASHRKSPYDERRDIRAGGDSNIDHRNSPGVFSGDRQRGGAHHSPLVEYRTTPVDRQKSPHGDSRSPLDHRKSPADNYGDLFQARSQGTAKRKTPVDKSLFDDEINTHKSSKDKIKSTPGHKSPFDSRSSPDSRKSPFDAKAKRQNAPGHRERDSPNMQRKGSVLDFLTETNGHHGDHSDDGGSRVSRRISPTGKKTPTRESKNPFDHVLKPQKDERSNHATHNKSSPVSGTLEKKKPHRQPVKRDEDQLQSDGESSICEELIEEPIKQKKSDKSDNTSTVTEVRAKSQTSTHQLADDAIELVKGAQSGNKMKYIDSPDGKSSKRPPSASGTAGSTSKVIKPQPRYAKPSAPKTAAAPSPSFDSTEVIRDAVFKEWKEKRLELAKQELLEKQRKEKEIEEKKLKDKQEKDEYAKKAYVAWLNEKKDFVSEKTKKKREEEEKAAKEEEEKKRKKEEAELTFTQWKASTDVKLKEKQKDSLKKTKKIEEAKKEEEKDKKKQAKSAYVSWKEDKDKIIYKSHEEKMRAEKEKERLKKREEKSKAEEARTAYEEWLDKKEATMDMQRTSSASSLHRSAWTPAGGKTMLIGR